MRIINNIYFVVVNHIIYLVITTILILFCFIYAYRRMRIIKSRRDYNCLTCKLPASIAFNNYVNKDLILTSDDINNKY